MIQLGVIGFNVRLSVSGSSNIIAIPQDNRHIRLYDLQGVRLARLAKSNRQVGELIVRYKRGDRCIVWH